MELKNHCLICQKIVRSFFQQKKKKKTLLILSVLEGSMNNEFVKSMMF